MEDTEREIKRKTPPGGSHVDTLRRLIEGDPASHIGF